jgi:2-polyprenyl-3-methyl-5-hydroxy-6-metoxy-1,4-benzoquinol methylase
MSEADWRKAVLLWRPHAATLLGPVPARGCPACGSSDSRYLFDSYDAHAFHECIRCGCWFTPKVVDWSVFERLFEISPEARAHAEHMMSARDDEVRQADMTRIGAYLDDVLTLVRRNDGRPIAYLDAGCGVGHSLRAGLERGLTVQGVEVDDAAVALARKAGLPVAVPGDIASMPRGPYQLLTFWETLEHIAEPLETIERYLPYLAEDGIVVITVPNLNALATRTLREACAWVHGGYNTPGHVNLFHTPALDRLLDRAGLVRLEAQGQFSADAIELAAFLTGATRGAFDELDPGLERRAMPRAVSDALMDIWPGVELIERLTLASPILRVIACRRGREGAFADALASRSALFRQDIADRARAMIAMEVDYKAMSAGLQAEVDRRDQILRDRTEQMQQEINRRDGLLTEERDRYRRTIDARVRSVARKLQSVLWR